MGEFYFGVDGSKTNPLVLGVDQPYKLVFNNIGIVKHEATAQEFFNPVAFRKVEDAYGEYKTPAPL